MFSSVICAVQGWC